MKFLPPIICCLLLASCGSTPPADEKSADPRPAAPRPQLVGRIASMPPGRTFVLIQAYGSWQVPDGATLTTRGPDERNANLMVTGEKLGQFAAADIRSGEVAIGDAVFLHPSTTPPLPAITPDPDDDPSPNSPQNGRDQDDHEKN